MLDLILGAVDQLANGRSFSLYGFSLGAYLARGIIYHRFSYVDGLMMVIPVIISQSEQRNVPQHTIIYEEPGIMQQLTQEEKEFLSTAAVRSQKFLQFMRDIPQPVEEGACDMEFLDAIREDPGAYKCYFDVDALDEPFPGPSLIITGRQDASVGYQDAWQILDNYPRATYVVLDRASHFMEEKDELIDSLFHDWLDRLEAYNEQQ